MNFTINKEKLKQLKENNNSKCKKYTILIVDDELANLQALTRLLEEEYIVIKAKDGFQALDILKNNSYGPNINLIISDQRMPGMTGVEFLKETISIMPNAIRMILTGFMDVNDIISSINEGHIYKFLLKPLEPTELLISVKRALEAYELGIKNIKLIEELKQMNEKLKKSKKYLNTIFNSVNEAIIIHDIYGNTIDVNDTAISLYGYSHGEFIGMNIKSIISEKQSYTYNGEEILRLIREQNGDSVLITEAIAKDKNNREFWIEGNARTIMVDEQVSIVTTIRDITERKKAELASKNEALELERLRTEFFANISHELRTPLNIILAAIQVLGIDIQNEEKPIDRRKFINNMNIQKQNCFRLLRLINNLIDSTKLDSGYFQLNMTNCNIINIVEEITLSVAEYINNNNLSLVFDTDIEEKIVACDLDKIERIMLNLLSNAVKFTDEGGSILVNILDGSEYITISVEDNGIGIPEEKIDLIFDRFRQVDKSFTRSCEGSGIGLSLVKSFLEMQGAIISVESKYGVGTKFIIKFPVKGLDCDDKDISEKANVDSKFIKNCVEKIRIEFSDIYKQFQ